MITDVNVTGVHLVCVGVKLGRTPSMPQIRITTFLTLMSVFMSTAQ